VSDSDAVKAADVGWQVIATFTTDLDEGFGFHASAYNVVLPDTWLDEETLWCTNIVSVQRCDRVSSSI
jgi:hypothetical protein